MTKEQERARARRRYEKRQTQLAQRQAAAARHRRIAAVVGVLLVVVALVVGISVAVGDRGTAPAAASRSAATSSASPSTTLAAGCAKPATAPTSVPSVSAPDFGKATAKTFTAVVTTTCGDIALQLDGAKAPQAVESFRHLARASYWKGSPCHRLTTEGIFVLQCGDPTGTGNGAPGYGFPVENAPADGKYPRGTVAMARTADPKSGNGSQFFLVYRDSELPTDTGGYSIFGTVTGGMDIVERIAAAGVAGGATDGAPAAPISIRKVAVTEKKA